MRNRTGWMAIFIGMVVLAGSSVLQAAPPAAGANASAIQEYMKTQAAAIADADTDTAVKIREEVESGLTPRVHGSTPSATFVQDYVTAAVQEFGPIAKSDTAKNQLTAVVLLANLSKSSEATDSALTDALGSKNAAIRYWAARGFGNILPKYSVVPTLYSKTVGKVRDALKKEDQPLVRVEMLRTLMIANDKTSATGTAIVDQMEILSGFIQKDVPSVSLLQAQVQAMTALTEFSKGGQITAAEKVKAAKAASISASYAMQYLQMVETKDPTEVTTELTNVTYWMVLRAVEAINSIAPSTKLELRGFSLNELSNNIGGSVAKVDAVLGTPEKPGQLQQIMPEVTAPGKIKK